MNNVDLKKSFEHQKEKGQAHRDDCQAETDNEIRGYSQDLVRGEPRILHQAREYQSVIMITRRIVPKKLREEIQKEEYKRSQVRGTVRQHLREGEVRGALRRTPAGESIISAGTTDRDIVVLQEQKIHLMPST